MALYVGVDLAGRYRLEAPLGRGGFGEVWRGVDTELGRPVAIRVMLPADVGVSVQQEARAAAALQHPGITVVHDIGRHDGQLFMVMELLDGRDLGRVLAETPDGLHPGQVRSIGRQVADALAAAHVQHVVHRDLKPANLMLLAGGRVKICDFGLARIIQATAHQTATVAGTMMTSIAGRLSRIDPGRAHALLLAASSASPRSRRSGRATAAWPTLSGGSRSSTWPGPSTPWAA